ncbi:uncharacterized protein LOC129294108 [Prosopis cineraria]|uniref:uncharacterized protein LOC129294108 n=1 Tax=Prosopis cineraria TaxID=364024 RepID=UPI0024108798|nr:uncharacterized protein LOC129294108 [Prosopis cineraria]
MLFILIPKTLNFRVLEMRRSGSFAIFPVPFLALLISPPQLHFVCRMWLSVHRMRLSRIKYPPLSHRFTVPLIDCWTSLWPNGSECGRVKDGHSCQSLSRTIAANPPVVAGVACLLVFLVIPKPKN